MDDYDRFLKYLIRSGRNGREIQDYAFTHTTDGYPVNEYYANEPRMPNPNISLDPDVRLIDKYQNRPFNEQTVMEVLRQLGY